MLRVHVQRPSPDLTRGAPKRIKQHFNRVILTISGQCSHFKPPENTKYWEYCPETD